MSARRKFSDEERQEILDAFYSDMGKNALGERFNLDYTRTIRRIWMEVYSKEEFDLRTSRLCALHKIGNKNPMYGKHKELHPRYKAVHWHRDGYKIVEAPDWYTGPTDKGRKVLEHIVIACEAAGITELPPIHVVHHKDENKLNNHPDNLEIMSRGKHMVVHRWLRHKKKVQRLSRRGVGSK